MGNMRKSITKKAVKRRLFKATEDLFICQSLAQQLFLCVMTMGGLLWHCTGRSWFGRYRDESESGGGLGHYFDFFVYKLLGSGLQGR